MKQQLHSEESSPSAERGDRPPKKLYSSPRLIVHGTVQDITKNLSAPGADSPTGSTPV